MMTTGSMSGICPQKNHHLQPPLFAHPSFGNKMSNRNFVEKKETAFCFECFEGEWENGEKSSRFGEWAICSRNYVKLSILFGVELSRKKYWWFIFLGRRKNCDVLKTGKIRRSDGGSRECGWRGSGGSTPPPLVEFFFVKICSEPWVQAPLDRRL